MATAAEYARFHQSKALTKHGCKGALNAYSSVIREQAEASNLPTTNPHPRSAHAEESSARSACRDSPKVGGAFLSRVGVDSCGSLEVCVVVSQNDGFSPVFQLFRACRLDLRPSPPPTQNLRHNPLIFAAVRESPP